MNHLASVTFSFDLTGNPILLVDPTGHRSCTEEEAATGDETCDQNIEGDSGGDVADEDEAEDPPPPPLVEFKVEDGQDWTEEEKEAIRKAARDVAVALARAMNEARRRWARMGEEEFVPVSPEEAWFLVYGGTVVFKRVTAECTTTPQCWGKTENARLILVYSNTTASNIINSPNFIVHELGHAFENANGGSVRDEVG